MNINNITNPTDLFLTVRIVGGSISSILSIFSLFANILLILALRKFNPGDCFAFYLINWQLIVADIANQIFFQLLLAIPIMFTGNAIYGHGIMLRIFGIMNTINYSCTLFFSALMTLNRATVFVSPKLNESLFSRSNILKPIIAIWIYAFVIGITLDVGDLLLGFVCKEETVHPIIWAIREYFHYSPSAMPVIMLITYLAIFVFIKISNPFKNIQNSLEAEQARKRFRSERSFLFQVKVTIFIIAKAKSFLRLNHSS